MIKITLPPLTNVTDLFGNSYPPDANDLLVYNAFKAFDDAVNARVADPQNKAITIPIQPIPDGYTEDSPFGSFPFKYLPQTLYTIQFLNATAEGINEDWNGTAA